MRISKKIVHICMVLIGAFTLTACHPQVAPVSMMDKELNCASLNAEIKDVERIKAKIESKRGFSGRNVGLALIFWPGILVNEFTGDTAENQANTRLVALQNIYCEKQCPAKLNKDLAMAEDQKESKKT